MKISGHRSATVSLAAVFAAMNSLGMVLGSSKRRSQQSKLAKNYAKRSGYSGAELRWIRAHGQDRECARRRARGCVQ